MLCSSITTVFMFTIENQLSWLLLIKVGAIWIAGLCYIQKVILRPNIRIYSRNNSIMNGSRAGRSCHHTMTSNICHGWCILIFIAAGSVIITCNA